MLPGTTVAGNQANASRTGYRNGAKRVRRASTFSIGTLLRDFNVFVLRVKLISIEIKNSNVDL